MVEIFLFFRPTKWDALKFFTRFSLGFKRC